MKWKRPIVTETTKYIKREIAITCFNHACRRGCKDFNSCKQYPNRDY